MYIYFIFFSITVYYKIWNKVCEAHKPNGIKSILSSHMNEMLQVNNVNLLSSLGPDYLT